MARETKMTERQGNEHTRMARETNTRAPKKRTKTLEGTDNNGGFGVKMEGRVEGGSRD